MNISYIPRSILRCNGNTKILFTSHLHHSVRRIMASTSAEKFEDPELASAKPFKDMPRVPMLPFIGSAWAYFPIVGKFSIKRQHEADLLKYRTYGDIVYEKIGPLNLVSSFVPETNEIFIRHEGKYPFRAEAATLKAYRESRKEWFKTIGMMILQGEEWWHLRAKTQKHLMKPRAIQAYLRPMQNVAKDFVNLIRQRRDASMEVQGLLEDLNKWSLESVALVGLDTRLQCLNTNLSKDSDGQKMIDAVQTTFYCMNKLEPLAGSFPFWEYLPSPTWKKFQKAGDTFTEISFKYINMSLDKLKSQSDEETELTLLQSLIMEKGLDISGVMVTVSDLLMAGIDSTSTTIGFLLYELARNPEKQKILFKEINELLPGKEDKITPEVFSKLRYLKACLKESIRLNPIVRGNVRTFDHDVVVSGYRIPAGTAIMCLLQVIYRNEKYFKNADKFIPERWLQKDQNLNPFAFLPFGIGTRSCVGRRLAELEMLSVATEIIRNFSLEYHHEDINTYTRLINVPDKPLRITFLDR